jgi:hypothetical protein
MERGAVKGQEGSTGDEDAGTARGRDVLLERCLLRARQQGKRSGSPSQ